jgi:predicted alpha-1,2-mannosidase
MVIYLAVASISIGEETKNLTQYVAPYIGSGGHGHIFVGANVPFGAVQVGPSNFFQGWDWCSGYHYSDDVVQGFTHLHISGTGCADLGDILIMPYKGEVTPMPGSREDPDTGFASRYSHDTEKVSPGYYAVRLDDYDIEVELTATERVGMHRYRYPKDATPHVAIDLRFENNDPKVGRATHTSLVQRDDYTLTGKRYSTGWAPDQRVFFAIKSSVPIQACSVFDNDRPLEESADPNEVNTAVLTFADGTAVVQLKVGISPVDEGNALQNIEAEAPGWDFDKVAAEALNKWNKELQVLRIKTDDETKKRIFYTALYHTIMAPILFNDHNGDYRGADKKIYRNAGFDNYTILSLWDTYRTAHPLFTLTQPERVNDFVQTMLAIYDQQGKLPVWHLVGCETDTMIGYHAVPVIVDAYFKGFRDYDAEKAYAAVKHSALSDERGRKRIKEIGYIPADEEYESVAMAMEYAIDDWCIAQMAKDLGHEDDYSLFMKRARYYQNYFDSGTGFMRGKLADGYWREPFDPFHSEHRKDDYCEGNAWQYLWLVPQDVEGLIDTLGGDERFASRLDELFTQG